MGQRLLVDSRFDPFFGTTSPYTITAEQQIIPNDAPFWVYLNEVPKQAVPSLIQIAGFLETAGYPGPGEFRADYRYLTGAVQFHAADKNKPISVTYVGLGSPIQAEFLDAIAMLHPQRSYYSDLARFDDIVDHFAEEGVHGAAALPNSSYFWEVRSPVADSGNLHQARISASGVGLTGYAFYKSRARYSPGAGILLRARMKVAPLSLVFNATLGLFVGFGSRVGVSSIYPLFCIANMINTVSGVTLLWCASPGGGTITGTLVLPVPAGFFAGTTYTEITALYTPGYLMGMVNGSLCAYASVFLPTLPGHLYMAVNHADYIHDLYLDYIQVRQTSPLEMP